MPRRSGTMTVRLIAKAAATGAHMSPVSPKPCSSTTAGPPPPTRLWNLASTALISWIRKPAGKGWIIALDPFDERLCSDRIADLGARDEVEEDVAVLGPRLGLLGPFVEFGGLVAGLDLVAGAHQAGIGEVGGRLVDLGEIRIVRENDRHVVLAREIVEALVLEAVVADLERMAQRQLADFAR